MYCEQEVKAFDAGFDDRQKRGQKIGMAVKFYAVKKGRTTGIFSTWDQCKAQTAGYPGALYKSFPTAEEAAAYLGWTQMTAESEEPCELTAYVDGSFNTATGEYGSGAILLCGGEEISLWEKGNDPELATMRNVAGEILASELAMKYAYENGYSSLCIYHDYEGIARWCTGEWKANKEGTKRYREVYRMYRQKIRIEFVKVKGHSGDRYNDVADSLAKKAVGLN